MAYENITSYIIGAAIVVFTIIYYIRKAWSDASRTFPPGPKGLPIVGSYFNVDMKRFHLTLCELGKRYGDVFMVTILGQRFLILNSNSAMREAFLDEKYAHIFSGRPPTFLGEYVFSAKQDLVFQTYTESWIRQRKMAFKLLRYYGKRVEQLENTVTEELQYVVQTLRATNSQPVDLVTSVLMPSLINIINILLKSERWSYDDKRMETIIRFLYDVDSLLNPDVDELFRRFPFLRHLPIGPGKTWRALRPAMATFLDIHFTQTKATYKEGVSRGVMDDMLTSQKENIKEHGVCWPSDLHLKGMLMNFMTAGVLTTRAALSTFYLHMLYNPEMYLKMQQEVDSVIGRDRKPCLTDRKRMPYTVALLSDNLRYDSHNPIGIPHSVLEDVEFRGYFIPKDTRVIANCWASHRDTSVWKKPDEFHPENFLDKSGNLLPKEDKVHRNLVSFGMGKRQCVGEAFAKSRMFLYVTTIAQNFNITTVDKAELPPEDPKKHIASILIRPNAYVVRATARDTTNK